MLEYSRSIPTCLFWRHAGRHGRGLPEPAIETRRTHQRQHVHVGIFTGARRQHGHNEASQTAATIATAPNPDASFCPSKRATRNMCYNVPVPNCRCKPFSAHCFQRLRHYSTCPAQNQTPPHHKQHRRHDAIGENAADMRHMRNYHFSAHDKPAKTLPPVSVLNPENRSNKISCRSCQQHRNLFYGKQNQLRIPSSMTTSLTTREHRGRA